jgi:hypothetical protein
LEFKLLDLRQERGIVAYILFEGRISTW